MILEKIKNKQGDDISIRQIYLDEEGIWLEETLNCFSSYIVNMGSCKCDDHPCWNFRVISRQEVREIIEERKISLSDEKKEDIYNPSFETMVQEAFALKGLFLYEIKNWIHSSLLLGMNPLNVLRKILPFANIELRYDNEGEIPTESKDQGGVVYIVLNSSPYNNSEENIKLVFAPPTKRK